MTDLADFEAKLELLNAAYVADLPGRLRQIEREWGQWPLDAWDDEKFQTLHRMVHSLTGSGKTFGFALLSEAARTLEEYLKSLAQAKAAPGKEQRKRIQILLENLHQAIKQR